MRHRKADKKLNRSYSLRKATLRDITRSVILYQSVKTTIAKAKEARKLVERLITLGKRGDLYSRRKAFQELCDHRLVGVLFNEVAPRFLNIEGGYTRILPWLNRRGDDARLAILELTIKHTKEKIKKAPAEEKEVKKPEPQSISEGKIETKQVKEVKKEELIEKKIAPPFRGKPKRTEIQPPKKQFFKGLKKFFKKERDSL